MTQSVMHQWARLYAQLGWHVFPLVPGTKSPFKDSKGSSEATIDLHQIDKWWSEHPQANIGTRPSLAGLYVFDVDPRNGGSESLATLEAQHGPLVSPLKVLSPGGGFHNYYSAPVLPDVTYSSAPAKGIDGKYNGYAVLPPSKHPSGGFYAWASGIPRDVTAAPIPSWLVSERTKRPEGYVAPAATAEDYGFIRTALFRKSPDEYQDWIDGIASMKHWDDHLESGQGQGYELALEWSAQSEKHDDGRFEDKWNTFDSFKPNARTVGSLVKEAGMDRESLRPDAAAIFKNNPPALVTRVGDPLVLTSLPVERYNGSTDPVELMAELQAWDNEAFVKAFAERDLSALIDFSNWWNGGHGMNTLYFLTHLPAPEPDSDQLRTWIAHNCTLRSSWRGVSALTREQIKAGLPQIDVQDGKWVSVCNDVLAALPKMGGVFQRTRRLVWVGADGTIGEYDQFSLSHQIETYMDVVKGSKPARIPEALAKRVLGSKDLGVPEIAAVVPFPVVRVDGTAVIKAGLDVTTGLYLLKAAERLPRVLDDEGLRQAVARVWAPFAEFPFEDGVARGVMFSALLTTVCRAAMPTSPVFMVSAQLPGSGKTKLSQCLMKLAGASTTVQDLPSKEEEQGKTIFTTMLAGPLGIFFDNVDDVLRAAASFCAAVTSPTYKARLLNTNRLGEVTNRALWVLNGNNVGIHGDAVRRILTCRLDSPENPEQVRHSFDPLRMVGDNVPGLRADLIDILTTYREAGLPQGNLSGFASFEEWNSLIRGCTMWLEGQGHTTAMGGLGDPMETIKEAQHEDPKRLLHIRLLRVWRARFGREALTLKAARAAEGSGPIMEEWRDVMDEICVFKGREDPSRLEYWLRGRLKAKVEGLRFVNDKGATGNAKVWSVQDA